MQSFSLQKEGFRSTSASIRARFVEARGYEPPSGRVFIEDDYNGLIKVDENGYAGSWTLSEDKEDRKDGLWIWGLFKEPKYPFLYFTLGAYNTTINARTNDEEPIFGGLGIPNEKLYIRFDHNVSPDRNHRLSNGRVEFKESEFVKADPFGVGGTVDVGDVVNGGSIQITPVLDDDEGAMSSIGHEQTYKQFKTN